MLKTEFKARPAYLTRDDRITAHFTTCFLALTLYRYLEQRLGGESISTDIIIQLKDMNFLLDSSEKYFPGYTRTDLIDALQDAFGFRTDYEIFTTKQMKEISGTRKEQEVTQNFIATIKPEKPITCGLSGFYSLTSVENETIP